MDLRAHFPRSIRAKLGGYVHLGRMIDKCRAVLAGTQGEYIYPCPMDRRLLEFAGIAPDEVSRVAQGQPDDSVASWFLAKATSHSQAEIEAWNKMMLSLSPDTEEKWAYFNACRNAVDPTRTDITTWADLLDLEERRPVPVRQAAPAC